MLAVKLQRGTMATSDGHKPDGKTPLHQPAMVSEVLSLLRVKAGHSVLDLTVGTGGHSLALAGAVGPDGLLVGIDADEGALYVARKRLEQEAPCPFELFPAWFNAAPSVARQAGVETFDAALADLGMGTHQLMDASRGFSFDSEARLDMRYDPTSGPSAWDVINRKSEEELADIFYEYGEERYSRQIAARICAARICEERPVETAAELADLVKNVVARRTPRRRTWRIHPATRVMMALRIYVNREFEELEALLEALPELLVPGGRAGIITYHSLEARRVKHTWRRQARDGLMEELSDSPWMPSEDEVERNPRVRSAQLRVARRL